MISWVKFLGNNNIFSLSNLQILLTANLINCNFVANFKKTSMKKLFLLVLIVFTTIFTYAQAEKYSKAKIYTDEQGMQKLSSLGIAVDEGIYRKGLFFISDFSETELGLIRSNGFKMEILVDDVVASGSTLDEAAKILKSAGAVWVGAVVFARGGKN